MNALVMVFVPFGIFYFGIFFLVIFCLTGRKTCPSCNKPLSYVQSPLTKSWRQWVEGGHRCQQCGCETDTAGRAVVPGAPPARRSLVFGFMCLVLAVLPAIALWAAILHR